MTQKKAVQWAKRNAHLLMNKMMHYSVYRVISEPLIVAYALCACCDYLKYFSQSQPHDNITKIACVGGFLLYMCIYHLGIIAHDKSNKPLVRWILLISRVFLILLPTIFICSSEKYGIILRPIPFVSYWGMRFYITIVLSLLLLGSCSIMWRVRNSVTQPLSYILVFGTIVSFELAIWFIADGLSLFYLQTPKVEVVWNWLCLNLRIQHGSSISWISIGGTFLTGCLVVISWAKDSPCASWNPFSAKELEISGRMPFLSMGVWTFICYATTMSYQRFAALCGVILLCTNIATSFYCHHLQSEKSIRRRVLLKLNCLSLPRLVTAAKLSIGSEPEQTALINRIGQRETEQLSHYIRNMQRISAHIINKMLEKGNKEQIRSMKLLIDETYEQLQFSKQMDTIGILIGMGCIPSEMDEYRNFRYYHYYITKMMSAFYDSSAPRMVHKFYRKADSNMEVFYAHVRKGMIIGLYALQCYHKNMSAADISYWEKNANCSIEGKLELIIKRYEKDFSKEHEWLTSVRKSMELGILSPEMISSTSKTKPYDNAAFNEIITQVYQ